MHFMRAGVGQAWGLSNKGTRFYSFKNYWNYLLAIWVAEPALASNSCCH